MRTVQAIKSNKMLQGLWMSRYIDTEMIGSGGNKEKKEVRYPPRTILTPEHYVGSGTRTETLDSPVVAVGKYLTSSSRRTSLPRPS